MDVKSLENKKSATVVDKLFHFWNRKFGKWVDVIAVFFLLIVSLHNIHVVFSKGPFYQGDAFSISIMQACGHAFADPLEVPAEFIQFMTLKADTFDCELLNKGKLVHNPFGNPSGSTAMQQVERYLMTSVALTWKLFGVSWSKIWPLFFLMFALSVTAVFAIFRLCMNVIFATIGALLIIYSPLHLYYITQLREYGPAPFALWSIWFLAVLVSKPLSQKSFFTIAACAGVVLGIGLGFRHDLMVYVPVFIITLLFFVGKNVSWYDRVKAIITFIGCYILVNFPILIAMSGGGNLGHVIILGLMNDFTAAFGLANKLYSIGYVDSDGFVTGIIGSFSERIYHHFVGLGTRDYERYGFTFLRDYAINFPADVLIRIYASVLGIIKLPLHQAAVIPAGCLDTVSGISRFLLSIIIKVSPIICIVVCALYEIRIAIFIVFMIIFLGGYPVLQFDQRHYFYLEFMGLFFIGFALQQIISCCYNLIYMPSVEKEKWKQQIKSNVSKALAFCLLLALLSYGVLYGVRLYQTEHLREFFQKYLDANISPVSTTAHDLPDNTVFIEIPNESTNGIDLQPGVGINTEYLKVELDNSCGIHSLNLNFYYDDSSLFNYSAAVFVGNQMTIFFPIYNAGTQIFKGIKITKEQYACIRKISRVTDLSEFPLLPVLMLPEDWRHRKLYQRFI